MIKKVRLVCGLALGDIVMLTAAVRVFHYWYPGRFKTAVRTSCADLWENNPYVTPLAEKDRDVEEIICSYPLINRCNDTPYHCLHGFIEFLNERLGLAIKPTAFKGDIHLSDQEKAWYSQVHELTGADIPFWIVAGGGKYDITIKWWDSHRYREVLDHFKGRIQFVQVGEYGHHHPKLEGALDLRGKTDLRQLIRLVYHAQGVLCSVTGLMHLCAAVETKRRLPKTRPCVVIAGGREPAHWEAYPGHQFIHTNGALPCCAGGGCWKERVVPLRDGNKRDRADHLCVDVVRGIPHCMDLISSAEVIRKTELYFAGGALRYLSSCQRSTAETGVRRTALSPYDSQPLNLHSAGMACDRYIETIPSYPQCYQGRGVVICGGGVKYFTNAWVCVNMLRHLGCQLPIQLWHLGRKELGERMKAMVEPLGVECVDAFKCRKHFPVRLLHGWSLKPYALAQSPFLEVLLLDADNVPMIDPEALFESSQFKTTGAIFWPDYELTNAAKSMPVWKSCGLRRSVGPEFESGQIVLNKETCWRALKLSLWFNENSDFYYQYLHGDKDTFRLAFQKLRQKYSLVPHRIRTLPGVMCQHDFNGQRIFQHRNMAKWTISAPNVRIPGFLFEHECRRYLRRLRRIWNGKIS